MQLKEAQKQHIIELINHYITENFQEYRAYQVKLSKT